jgi:poly(A) polymerase
MSEYLKYLSDPIFKLIGESGNDLDQDTYVVGGYVRDSLLNRPTKDIDIVTVGAGIELARKVAEKLGDKVNVNEYKNFGTALIKFNDYEIEFVGARKESYRRNSRKPIVEEGTLKDDQDRRDFTINSMAFSLNNENYGELLDPHGGVLALEYKEIKTPLEPAATYSDDPLRMMRAIRFATQLNFEIEERSFQSIKEYSKRLEIVSQERITDELNKIILADKPSKGFLMLDECGILKIIFPEMSNLKGIDIIDGKGHKDNFLHTLQVLDNVSRNSNNLWLRWSAILHDIAKPATKRFDKRAGWTFHGHDDLGSRMVPNIFRRMKLPLDHHMKYVQKLVKLHLRPIALVKDIVTDTAIRRLLIEGGEDLDDLMLLCEADITTKNKDKVQRYLSNFKKVRAKMKEVEEKDHLINFQPPVSGQMIMETFNLQPGREVGKIKTLIKEAILEGIIPNEIEAAKELMLSVGQKMGLKISNERK